MKLRKLEAKDAPFMYEWMHEESVVCDLYTDFMSKTMDDCKRFIEYSNSTDDDVNLAIVDESDEYMGTVSLKHLDKSACIAEFAITIRSCAMGKGISKLAMSEILDMGFEQFGLKEIYWCVSKKNLRAVRFYDKNAYERTEVVPDSIVSNYSAKQLPDFIWYKVQR